MSERMQRLAQFCLDARCEDLPLALDTFGAAQAAARISLPYALAARLVHGHCRLPAYDDDLRCDPRIAPWMSRIRLEVDPQLSEDGG